MTPACRPVIRAMMRLGCVRVPGRDPGALAIQARLVEIEARANELRADLERERQERLKERDRTERLVGEVADLARQLARVVDEAGARERDLRDRLTTVHRPRPRAARLHAP